MMEKTISGGVRRDCEQRKLQQKFRTHQRMEKTNQGGKIVKAAAMK